MNANDNGNSFSDTALVDVLSDAHYAAEHIPGAVNFCVYEIAFLDKMRDAFPLLEEHITVYGYSDDTEEASRARGFLESAGYTNVHVLLGGLKRWKENGGKTDVGVGAEMSEGVYEIRVDESTIAWTGRKIGKKHHGTVTASGGSLSFKSGVVKSGVITVDMRSIADEDLTDSMYRNMLVGHLKSDDFFGVEKYPVARLNMKNFTMIDGVESKPNYMITADLTIKEYTHEISIEASIREQDKKIFLNAHFDIDRTLWHVKYGTERFFSRLGMHAVDDTISFDVVCVFEKK